MEWKLFADLAEIAGTRHISLDTDRATEMTVDDALDELLAEYPSLRDRVRDDSGAVRDHLSILCNGTDIRNEDGLATPITEDDELALLPPVSGG